MKRMFFFCLIVGIIIQSSCNHKTNNNAISNQTGKQETTIDAPVEFQVKLNDSTSEFFTVEVKGTPYERGFQHGKALRKVIRPTLNRFKYNMVSEFLNAAETDLTWIDYKKFFYEETGLYKNAVEQVPDLVEEIRGIAEGAGLDFKDVFAFNLNFDETFWVLEKLTGIDPMLASEKALLSIATPVI